MEIPIVFKTNEEQIIGILHLPKKEKSPLIILIHGWGRNKLGTDSNFFVKVAREFCKNNFAVLRFDFRGSGDSEGDFKDQTITSMLQDLDTVITQISKNPYIDKEKICLIGHSQGGYVSLLQSSKDKRVKCVILWAGRVSDLKDFLSKMWFEELERKGYIESYDYFTSKKYVEDSLKYNISAAVEKIQVPVGMIYGESDDVIPPSEGVKLSKMLKSKKELIILENLDHVFTGKIKEKVISITLSWVKKWL